MRSDTQSITISSSPLDVLSFVAEPENLPRWAIGFAKAVEPGDDGEWIVDSSAGEIQLRIETDPGQGTVDYVMKPAADAEAVAYSRVVPNGGGAEYIFTQFQSPGMTDEIFEGQVDALHHELTTLKALLEVECPA